MKENCIKMGKKSYLKFGIILTVENIVLGIIKFLFSILIVKKFGSNGQGDYSYLNTISSYFTIFAISLIDQTNIVRIPHIKSKLNQFKKYFGTSLLLSIILILLALIVVYILVTLNFLQKINFPFYLVAIYISIIAFRQTIRGMILSIEKYYFHSIINITIELLLLSLLYVANSLQNYIFYSFFLILCTSILFFLKIFQWNNFKISFSKFELKNIFNYGSKMYFNVILQTLLLRIDVFFVIYNFNAKILSYYMICTVFAELIILPSKSITSIILNKTINENHSLNINNFRILSSLIFINFLGVLTFGYFLIPILYGAEYSAQLNVFVIQCIGATIVAFNYIYSYYLLGLKKNNLIVYANIITILPSLTMYYLFTKQFGIIGTSIASSLSYLIVFCCYIVWLKKSNPIFKSNKFILPTPSIFNYLKVLKLKR